MIVDPDDSVRHDRLHRTRRSGTLLAPLYWSGEQLGDAPALTAMRERAQAQLAQLDDGHKRFDLPAIYPVGLSPQLNATVGTGVNSTRPTTVAYCA